MDDAGPKALLLNIDFLKEIPSEDIPTLISLVLAMITCLIISAICASSENAFFSHKENDLEELEGKTLGCWCKPKTCHGDVLVELVNDMFRTDGFTI